MEWLSEFVGWVFTASAISNFSAELWISLSAIGIAVWNGRQTRLHAGLSVVPAFSVWADYPRGDNLKCVVRLSNKGFGPAIIESVNIFHCGRRIDGYMFEKMRIAIESAFGDQLIDISEVASDEKGHAFGVGDETVLANFKIAKGLADLGAEGVGARMQHLALMLTYRDIYGNRWYFLVREFVGTTWRRNSPAHLMNSFLYRRYL